MEVKVGGPGATSVKRHITGQGNVLYRPLNHQLLSSNEQCLSSPPDPKTDSILLGKYAGNITKDYVTTQPANTDTSSTTRNTHGSHALLGRVIPEWSNRPSVDVDSYIVLSFIYLVRDSVM